MKFLWTTIHVKDLEVSLKFYQEIVGLPLKRRFNVGPSMELAFLGKGEESELELICKSGEILTGNMEGISIGFSVESADLLMESLRGKGMAIVGPFQPNPHMKFFTVKDPDGFNVQFVQSL